MDNENNSKNVTNHFSTSKEYGERLPVLERNDDDIIIYEKNNIKEDRKSHVNKIKKDGKNKEDQNIR